jgi:uncharacterized protein YeaO (DUF488 family)
VFRTKRVYEAPAASDGHRVLVDRLWPRGVSKPKAAVGEWLRDLAPSNELRRWYGHRPERAAEFARRYRGELASRTAELEALRRRARRETVTLVFAASQLEGSNAEVLLDVLRSTGRTRTSRRSTGTATG